MDPTLAALLDAYASPEWTDAHRLVMADFLGEVGDHREDAVRPMPTPEEWASALRDFDSGKPGCAAPGAIMRRRVLALFSDYWATKGRMQIWCPASTLDGAPIADHDFGRGVETDYGVLNRCQRCGYEVRCLFTTKLPLKPDSAFYD